MEYCIASVNDAAVAAASAAATLNAPSIHIEGSIDECVADLQHEADLLKVRYYAYFGASATRHAVFRHVMPKGYTVETASTLPAVTVSLEWFSEGGARGYYYYSPQ